jgi:hypothetical protein
MGRWTELVRDVEFGSKKLKRWIECWVDGVIYLGRALRIASGPLWAGPWQARCMLNPRRFAPTGCPLGSGRGLGTRA